MEPIANNGSELTARVASVEVALSFIRTQLAEIWDAFIAFRSGCSAREPVEDGPQQCAELRDQLDGGRGSR